MSNRIGLLACKSGETFAKKVCEELIEISRVEGDWQDVGIRKSTETVFANMEIKTIIDESIRGQDIYIFQDVENKTNDLTLNDNYMALKTAIDAAHRADARTVSVVIPYFPYSRQDKVIAREGVTASIIAEELENMGVSRIITIDIHNQAISGFFRKTILENLYASYDLIKYVKKNFDMSNLVVVSPDTGGTSRAQIYAEKLQRPMAVMYKQRDYSKASTLSNMYLLGDVLNKDALIVDDMIATGGTSVKAVEILKQKGARKVYFACALPLFNGHAVELLSKFYEIGLLDAVIGTDAITLGDNFSKKNKWYHQVSVARYVAKVIFNIQHGKSVSYLLK